MLRHNIIATDEGPAVGGFKQDAGFGVAGGNSRLLGFEVEHGIEQAVPVQVFEVPVSCGRFGPSCVPKEFFA
ncbi:MAG TPA: hypothetical protein VMS21_00810 [Methylomirabilota bacterium]|nr:hypothetical protein [Methylomirabilota bacterium]